MLYFTGSTWFDPGENYIWYRSLCFVPVLSQLEEKVAMALSSTHGKVVMTTSNPNPTNPTRALTPQFGSLSAHRPEDLSFAQLWIWGLTPTPITMQLKSGVMTGDTVCQYLRSISFFHLLCIYVFFFSESFLLRRPRSFCSPSFFSFPSFLFSFL